MEKRRRLAFFLFVILLGLGVLAFMITLNPREDALPPIPPAPPFFEDLIEPADSEEQQPEVPAEDPATDEPNHTPTGEDERQ